jgi:hypothetical protein
MRNTGDVLIYTHLKESSGSFLADIWEIQLVMMPVFGEAMTAFPGW